MAVNISADAVLPCRADRARTSLDALLGATGSDEGRTSITRLHWESDRRLRRLLPTVEADIAVTAIDDTSSLLTVAGEYLPPFGAVGRIADRAVMHRFAESTATEFVDQLRRVVAARSASATRRGGGHEY